MKLKNDLLLRTARGEDVERPPVWLMRQAGRILPQYRAVRASLNSFIELVKNPELAAEVTIQPVDELNVDAAIIFSDILVIPEAMGLPYEMVAGKGPYFPKTIETGADIEKLGTNSDNLTYVFDAIEQTKKELNGRVPLIGFAGAPFTILAYMVEGSGSKTFSRAKAFLYRQPKQAHQLLEKITETTIAYLQQQIGAGADLIQLFDSWGGILSPDSFREFSLPYLKAICRAIDQVPVTVFAKGAFFALEEIGKLDCQVVGVDWNTPSKMARNLIPDKTLQGNLDPCQLYGSEQKITEATHKMIRAFGRKNYIVNLGHGVYPDTPLENVKRFVEAVRNFEWNE